MKHSIVIDTGKELLVDRSRIRCPQMRMLMVAIGIPLVRNSAWVCVNKQVAALYQLLPLHAPVSCDATPLTA